MRPWRALLAAGAVAILTYVLLPAGSTAQAVLEVALHALTVPAILVGIRLHRPTRPTGWYVIAASQVVYAIANVVGAMSSLEADGVRSYPNAADLLYLVAYGGFAAGLIVLLVRRSRGQGVGILIDTLTVTIGLSSLVWVFLVEPMVSAPDTSLAATLTTAGYALFDVAVVAALIGLALSPGARNDAFWLLGGAMVAQLVGDAWYAVASMGGDFALGHPAFVMWMSFYALLGACALHPSMRVLTEPGDAPPAGLRARARMIALTVAALVPPTAILFQDADGSVTGLAWITIFTFVTVLIRLFRTHQDLEQYEAVERLRREFVSVVSHELRTPLTVIQGVVDSLDRGVGGPLPDRARPLLAMAASNGRRLHRLVDDLLDVQRHAAGQVTTVMGAVAVTELFERVCAELSDRAAAAGVRLTMQPLDARLRGDEQRLQQVLVNLVDNGLKFCDAGGTVHLSAETRSGEVLIRVTDDGRGIPAAMHERIFDPFQQVDASDARERNGTGLGLAICRSLVEQHGGRIWVESAPGHGSTFLVSLPLAGELALLSRDVTEDEATHVGG